MPGGPPETDRDATAAEPVTVLIAARYASVRAGLAAMLRDVDDLEIAGEVGSAADLAAVLRDRAPRVVVLDLDELELRSALEAAQEREISVVVFTEIGDPVSLRLLEGLPGWALLPRVAEQQQVILAVRAAAMGLAVEDAAMARRAAPQRLGESAEARRDEQLTSRERQVLQLLAQGLPNKTIAARMDISPHTVKFHVTSIMAKLGASSRTEAVTLGARRGDLKL